MPERILVTGANGQLGSALRTLVGDDARFTFAGRDTVDLSDIERLNAFLEASAFDAVINCAAYTAVDKAETDASGADAVNRRAVEALAAAAKRKKMTLVHVSTDYVFDGKSHRPYTEEDPTAPQGVYGQSKRDGEKALMAVNPRHSAIIRTSWVYSEDGGNFVKTMLRLGKSREELGVVYDQVGAPTYARDLAQAILVLLPQLQNDGTEIFHYSNEGVCSWYDFAKAIFDLSDVECRVRPIETREYPTPAVRPHYTVLNKAKIKSRFGLAIPYWRDSLRACLTNLEAHE